MNSVFPEANSCDCTNIRGKETPINMKQLPVDLTTNAEKLLQQEPEWMTLGTMRLALRQPGFESLLIATY